MPNKTSSVAFDTRDGTEDYRVAAIAQDSKESQSKATVLLHGAEISSLAWYSARTV
jgi:hypothetical protein